MKKSQSQGKANVSFNDSQRQSGAGSTMASKKRERKPLNEYGGAENDNMPENIRKLNRDDS